MGRFTDRQDSNGAAQLNYRQMRLNCRQMRPDPLSEGWIRAISPKNVMPQAERN